MKFLQHLLVAPAALGLLAPIAVSAGEFNDYETTTKVSGTTTFIVGATDFEQTVVNTGSAVISKYAVDFSVNKSFTGEDALIAGFEAGNDDANNKMSTASSVTGTRALDVHSLYYQFPIGDDFTATIGAKVRQDQMLGVWPSAYPSDSVLDVMT